MQEKYSHMISGFFLLSFIDLRYRVGVMPTLAEKYLEK